VLFLHTATKYTDSINCDK